MPARALCNLFCRREMDEPVAPVVLGAMVDAGFLRLFPGRGRTHVVDHPLHAPNLSHSELPSKPRPPVLIFAEPDLARVLVPHASALVAGFREVAWLSPDGEIEVLSPTEARVRIERETPMLCHARATARRLDLPGLQALDLLELFAFVRPAQFCVPTPRGIAAALGLSEPSNPAEACVTLVTAARSLLQDLAGETDAGIRAIAEAADRAGWSWGVAVLAALPPTDPDRIRRSAGLRAWMALDEWQERPAPPPPGNLPVGADEARRRLAALLGDSAEPRPQQADYIAAASLWAERNQGSVWISTFTRNLQSQIAAELDRLYPEPAQKRRRIVIRKGRENFLCLLNYEDAVRATLARAQPSAPLALIARWILATESGDLVAGDFPGWLAELIGGFRVNALADRRGECVHSACQHFRKCFVEKNVRAARHARLVVANHALVMAQAALGGLDDGTVPTRYVFDEGHHLLDAADSAFSVRLSGREGRELRRWILGAEATRSRARGLQRRIGDLIEADESGTKLLVEALVAARILPADGWHQRIAGGAGLPGFESFLGLVRQQVLARSTGPDTGYGLEAEARPPVEGLVEAASRLTDGLGRLANALMRLVALLRKPLEDPDNPPDPTARQRLDAVIRAVERRGGMMLGSWCALLRDLGEAPQPDSVEWLALERFDSNEI